MRRDKDGRFWIQVHLDVRVMTKNHIHIHITHRRPVMVKAKAPNKMDESKSEFRLTKVL